MSLCTALWTSHPMLQPLQFVLLPNGEGAVLLLALSSMRSSSVLATAPLADFLTCGFPTGCADRVQVAAGARRLLPPGLAGLLRAQPRTQPGRPGQGVARGRRAVPHAGPQGAPQRTLASKACWSPAEATAHNCSQDCQQLWETLLRYQLYPSCKSALRTAGRGRVAHS